MQRVWLIAICALVLSLMLGSPSNAQQDQDAPNEQILKLYNAGRYAEAVPLAEDALVMSEKRLGSDNPKLASSLNTLALLYVAQGRFGEAEPLYKRSLAIWEKALGPEHPNVATALNNLAGLYQAQGRFTEVETLFKRSLAIREKALGPEHPDVANSLSNLAMLYQDQGRYRDAEPLLQRSIAIDVKALGPEHSDVAGLLNNLAELYHSQGRYGDAEPLYKRSLVLCEKALGPEHPDVARSLNDLAVLFMEQHRNADAEPLLLRSLAIREKALGPEHPEVAESLHNLAAVYQDQGRPSDAEPLLKRALAIREKVLGPEHPNVAVSLSNLAQVYVAQGRNSDAEPLLRRALAIREKVLGPEHPDVAASLSNLAEFYLNQGRNSDARPLLARSLGIEVKVFGPDHPDVALTLNYFAHMALNERDYGSVLIYLRQATAILERRVITTGEPFLDEIGKTEVQGTAYLDGLVKVASRLEPDQQYLPDTEKAETFEAAQWARNSQAAGTLAQMATRGASGDARLAELVRERQDLTAEWQSTDKRIIAAKSADPDKRNFSMEKALGDRQTAIDARLVQIAAIFKDKFPDYAALTSPKPASITTVQSHLRDDEALVLFLNTGAPEETFIWVVTNTKSRWAVWAREGETLDNAVAVLRCGLDRNGNWQRSKESRRWIARNEACASLRPDGLEADEPLPFDLVKASEVYKGLFGDVGDLIKGKSLLIVPSGALTALPFQVLVTNTPASPHDYGQAAWLIRDHAITILPSVASLVALRQNAKATEAPEPYIGFGDPQLDGSPRCPKPLIPDKCPDEETQVAANDDGVTRSAGSLEGSENFFRDGLADVGALKTKLCPLPDTVHELTCVARSLGASQRTIVIGKDMTETVVKNMYLDRYRIIHFATHGLLAGETARMAKVSAEPALVFSPPDTPTEEDDGLLTASEVAGLKLNADWVIMSACNTASGSEPGAEALSGLAKAFFYAGARALLVSHWPVNSYAATMLTSRTFSEMKKDKSIGRAEAFRRAMLALIGDKDRPWAAHPSIWAPFVIVGEGAAGR